jgi:hypothetical protein
MNNPVKVDAHDGPLGPTPERPAYRPDHRFPYLNDRRAGMKPGPAPTCQ